MKHHRQLSHPAVALLAAALWGNTGYAQTIQGVAIPEEQNFKGVVGTTNKDSKPDYPKPATPQPGSPNVVYIVLDDVGFADLGAYGSEIHPQTSIGSPKKDCCIQTSTRALSALPLVPLCSPDGIRTLWECGLSRIPSMDFRTAEGA